jgi:hypothetical protein
MRNTIESHDSGPKPCHFFLLKKRDINEKYYFKKFFLTMMNDDEKVTTTTGAPTPIIPVVQSVSTKRFSVFSIDSTNTDSVQVQREPDDVTTNEQKATQQQQQLTLFDPTTILKQTSDVVNNNIITQFVQVVDPLNFALMLYQSSNIVTSTPAVQQHVATTKDTSKDDEYVVRSDSIDTSKVVARNITTTGNASKDTSSIVIGTDTSLDETLKITSTNVATTTGSTTNVSITSVPAAECNIDKELSATKEVIPLSVSSAIISQSSTKVLLIDTDATATTTTSSTATVQKTFLLLTSSQSLKREIGIMQEKAINIVKMFNIPYLIIDGADSTNKDVRTILFNLTNLRGQYPQFFIISATSSNLETITTSSSCITTSNTIFWGDFDKFEYMNECGTLQKELCSITDSSNNGHVDSSDTNRDLNTIIPSETTTTIPIKEDSGANSNTATTKKLLMLYSNQSFKRDVLVVQDKAKLILSSLGIQYDSIDGAELIYKDRRNELFTLSGQRGVYPQFFIIDNNSDNNINNNNNIITATTTKFWGTWDQFESSHENSTLVHDLFSS